MRSDDPVVAILCADLHLSQRPPVARSEEPDWFEVMARFLGEIEGVAMKHEEVPILCAGDIFDRWNSSPELINFTIQHLPRNMYTIPGQHDLPLHNLEDLDRSAYQTLILSNTINELDLERWTEKTYQIGEMLVYGFPFGIPIAPLREKKDGYLHIAVAHQYVWKKDSSYPGAPPESHVNNAGLKELGYDVIVFGDNHKGFLTTKGNTTIFNCGTMMRRKTDEADYRPHVGLLCRSGKVGIHHLDISKDKLVATTAVAKVEENEKITGFIRQLSDLQSDSLDFREAMIQTLDKLKPDQKVREAILQAMEEKKHGQET